MTWFTFLCLAAAVFFAAFVIYARLQLADIMKGLDDE